MIYNVCFVGSFDVNLTWLIYNSLKLQFSDQTSLIIFENFKGF